MIKINGTTVEGMTAKYNGSILTLTGKNIGMTLTKLAQMLSDNPVIEVVEDGSVRAIYQSMQLNTLAMETVGGALVVTVAMVAKTVKVPGGDDSEDLPAQIEEVRTLAQSAVDAVTAIEEGMSHV